MLCTKKSSNWDPNGRNRNFVLNAALNCARGWVGWASTIQGSVQDEISGRSAAELKSFSTKLSSFCSRRSGCERGGRRSSIPHLSQHLRISGFCMQDKVRFGGILGIFCPPYGPILPDMSLLSRVSVYSAI